MAVKVEKEPMLQIVMGLRVMEIPVTTMRLRMVQVFLVEGQSGGPRQVGHLVCWVQGHMLRFLVLHLHLGLVSLHLLQAMVLNFLLDLTWKARRTSDHGWTQLFQALYLVLSRWMLMVGP